MKRYKRIGTLEPDLARRLLTSQAHREDRLMTQKPRQDIAEFRMKIRYARRMSLDDQTFASFEVDRLQIEAARGSGKTVLSYPQRRPR